MAQSFKYERIQAAVSVARSTMVPADARPQARALTRSAREVSEDIHMPMVSFVVMEPGSEWPGHLGDHSNLVAFSQKDEKLLERTEAELDSLRRDQQNVRVAVLACNAEMDGGADGYREKIARTLLAAVKDTTFGRLVLSASGGASLRLRQELFSLAGTLSEQLRGTTATVSLRFPEASRG
jgi:hypothetical protein